MLVRFIITHKYRVSDLEAGRKRDVIKNGIDTCFCLVVKNRLKWLTLLIASDCLFDDILYFSSDMWRQDFMMNGSCYEIVRKKTYLVTVTLSFSLLSDAALVSPFWLVWGRSCGGDEAIETEADIFNGREIGLDDVAIDSVGGVKADWVRRGFKADFELRRSFNLCSSWSLVEVTRWMAELKTIWKNQIIIWIYFSHDVWTTAQNSFNNFNQS